MLRKILNAAIFFVLLSVAVKTEIIFGEYYDEEDSDLDECDPDFERAIVLKEREFPSVVSIQKDGLHRCSGVILNEDWILTTAHCVKPFGILDSWTVNSGSNDLWRGFAHSIIEYAIHEYYDPADERRSHSNDIAILKVDPQIDLGSDVQMAKLPRKHQKTPVGANVTLVGWDLTPGNKTASRKLKKVYRLIGDPEYCWNSVWGRKYQKANKGQICARGDKGTVGEHEGKYGWTMHYNGEVIGVSSWGDPKLHEYYENVAWYIIWIEKRITWW